MRTDKEHKQTEAVWIWKIPEGGGWRITENGLARWVVHKMHIVGPRTFCGVAPLYFLEQRLSTGLESPLWTQPSAGGSWFGHVS